MNMYDTFICETMDAHEESEKEDCLAPPIVWREEMLMLMGAVLHPARGRFNTWFIEAVYQGCRDTGVIDG